MSSGYGGTTLGSLGFILILLTWGFLTTMSLLFPQELRWAMIFDTAFISVSRIPGRFHIRTKRKQAHKVVRLSELLQIWASGHISITLIFQIVIAAVSRLSWFIIHICSFGPFLLSFTLSEIIFSNIFDIFRIYASLIWVTYSLFSYKQAAASNGMTGNENDWTFGQLLPLLLLALPLFTILEICYGEFRLEILRRWL